MENSRNARPPAQGVYYENYLVRSYETGPDGRACPAALCRYIEDMAGAHASLLGSGLQDLLAQGCTWVLSRLRVRFFRRPAYREEVFGETWPTGIDRLLALRDFLIRDREDRILAAGNSAWLIIDLEKRRPQRPGPFVEKFFINPRRALNLAGGGAENGEVSAPRLEYPGGGEKTAGLRVPYSALDLNNHVNNVNYITWALDALGPEFRGGGEIADLGVNFLSECRCGENIQIHTVERPGPPDIAGTGQTGALETVVSQKITRRAPETKPETPGDPEAPVCLVESRFQKTG
ncbi:MAG: hypothetical protein LBQ61_10030 [Spirochaetales bacterium]|jgi:acyl-ACP thioesterase|nr:hypothetical protein [Spirochaetales bacterium]